MNATARATAQLPCGRGKKAKPRAPFPDHQPLDPFLAAMALAEAAETDWRLAAAAYEQALTAWCAASSRLVEHVCIDADGHLVDDGDPKFTTAAALESHFEDLIRHNNDSRALFETRLLAAQLALKERLARIERERSRLGLDTLEMLEDAAAKKLELYQKLVLESVPTTMAGALGLASFAATAGHPLSTSDLLKAIRALRTFLETHFRSA
jgi:hypothetical protein